MASVYQFSDTEILAFFLVLMRLSAFVVSWPVFGVETVPAPVKILLGLVLAIVVFPTVAWRDAAGLDLESMQIVWLSLREVFIGLSLGFLARLFFFAVHIGGEVISSSMGLANAQIFNPSMGVQSSATEQFYVVLATLFFLALNGHHLLLSGIVESFRLVPISPELLSFKGFTALGPVIQKIMEIGLKISAPVMMSILFINLAMAVVGRAVPQINVLITSLPVNILVGFLVLIISAPLMIWMMHDLLQTTTEQLFAFIKSY